MDGLPLALHPALSGVPYPGHLESFLIKIAALVYDAFGDDAAKMFRWMDAGHKQYCIFQGDLDSKHHVKLTISDTATVVNFYIMRPESAWTHTKTRMTLRNDVWDDFIGWISLVKMEYANGDCGEPSFPGWLD